LIFIQTNAKKLISLDVNQIVLSGVIDSTTRKYGPLEDKRSIFREWTKGT